MCLGFQRKPPGLEQTVPRSELYAWLVVVSKCVGGGAVTLVSDSKVCADVGTQLLVEGLERLRFDTSVSNADLWNCFLYFVRRHSLQVTLRWVKGHVDDVATLKNMTSVPFDLFGNACADVFANKGAQFDAVEPAAASRVLDSMKALTLIHRRADVVVRCLDKTPASRSTKPARARTTRQSKLDASQHDLVEFGKNHFACCWRLATRPVSSPNFWLWIASSRSGDHVIAQCLRASLTRPCPVPRSEPIMISKCVVHPSHLLLVVRGCFLCKVCGSDAVDRIRLLQFQCSRVLSQDAAKIVERFREGHLPRNVANRPWVEKLAP